MRNIISRFFFTLLALTLGFGQMWGATSAAAGTYETAKPSSGGKALDMSGGSNTVFVYRPKTGGNSSFNTSDPIGIKTTGNANGVAFYISTSMKFYATLNQKKESKNKSCDVKVYQITESLLSTIAGATSSQLSSDPSGLTDTELTDYKKTVSYSSNADADPINSAEVTLPAGYYYVLAVESDGNAMYWYSITLSAASATAPTITAPTTDQSATYTVGDVISALEVTATGSPAPTYQWYSNTSASTTGATSLGSGAQTASYTPDNSAASDLYYYCVATNSAGSATSPYFHVTINTPSTPTHDITYTNTKGADNSANPTEYYEGVGVASFEPLTDVADFHFTGWSPASIADDATTDQTIDAQWVPSYNVTFSAGEGSGAIPDAFQKWEGATFELPAQGSLTHATKVFDGWKANGAGENLAAGSTYNMGSADVEFVAQWKKVPVTIFHWKSNTGTVTMDAANGTTTGGTTTLRTTDSGKSWGNESVTYNASVAADMKGETSGKELKPGGNANYLELTLTSGSFQEGDVIYVTGYNNWAFLTSAEGIASVTEFDVANVATGSSKSDAVTGSATIPAGIDAATIYARRANGSSSAIAAIKVTRILKDIVSTVNTLTDAKVNGSSISAANLATLVSDHSLALSDAEASAPTITFNKHTVITYDDASTKTTDTPIEVVASDNGAGKWTASTTIDAVTYTVTLDIAAGHSVIYDANGGSGTMTDANVYAENEEVTVLENTFTAPAANQKFNGWSSSPSVTISAGKFNMPASDVTLSAQWKEFFTITYMDGTTPLGTEDVFVGDAPVGLSPAPTKPLSSFEGWKDELDADVDVTTLTAAATVYAKWNKAYATSYDMEAYAVSDGATLATLLENLTAANYAYTNVNSIDNGHTHNYIYDGMKYKTNDGNISFNVVAGKLVIVKTGNLPTGGAEMYVNGVADPTVFTSANEAEETHKNNYFYSAVEALYRLDMNGSKGTCILKAITITDPFTVSFEAHGDANPGDLLGQPSVTLPTPTNGSASFLGWFDAETGGNKIGDAGASYTPTADITLHAQWETVSTAARLASIIFSSAAGTLSPAFDPEVVNYTYTMPYPTADVPTIVSATSVNANAQAPVIDAQAAAWNETAIIRGVAQSGDSKAYNITMKLAPKDGVSIIKVATTGGTDKTVTGLYAGDGDVNLSSSTKMDNGKYIGFTLAGTTLQVGDQINVHTTTAANTGGSHIIFYDNMTDKNELYETGEIGVAGDNIFTINAAMVGQATAYVYRSNADDAHKWNGYVDFIEVLRPMNPLLKSVTVAGVVGTPVGTTVTLEVPFTTPATAFDAITYDWISNDDAWTAAHTPVAANAWEFGVANTVTFTDKDGDASVYTITVNKAAASTDATLSALTVNGNAVALVSGQFTYDVELPHGTSVAPTVVATANHIAAVATVDPCTLTGATITVVPESGAGDQKVYTLNFTINPWEEVVIWDGSTMTEVAASPGALGMAWEVNNYGSINNYNATCGEKAYTKYLPSSGTAPGRYVALTVPAGYMAKFYIVVATHSDGDERGMFIGSNLVKDPDATSVLELSNNNRAIAVAGMSEIVGAGTYYINANASIDFYEIRVLLRKGYVRDDSWMAPGELGTVCYPEGLVATGGDIYELVGKNDIGKIVFSTVPNNEMEPGVPYLFQATSNRMVFYATDATPAAGPDNSGAMKGTFGDLDLTELENVYYFAGHALWSCSDITSLEVKANRAWVVLDDNVPTVGASPAPGRRYITMDVHGNNAPTGMDELNAAEAPVKMIIDGKMFILRGEKLYNANGQLVK